MNSSDLVAMEAPMVTTREGESIVPAFDWHKRTVDATHALVLHTEALHSMVGLANAASKFAPITSSVCTVPDVHAPLEGKAWVSTGASKENTKAAVAAAARLTVAAMCTEQTAADAAPEARHRATDVEVQDTVVHTEVPICTLIVASS